MSGKRYKNHRNRVHNNHDILQDESSFDSGVRLGTEFQDLAFPFPQKDGAVSTSDRSLHLNTQLTLPCGGFTILSEWGRSQHHCDIVLRQLKWEKSAHSGSQKDLSSRLELKFILHADVKSLGIQLPEAEQEHTEKENKGLLMYNSEPNRLM